MRIAIVSPIILGLGMTPETYSSQQLNLAERWAQAGHEVDVYTLPGQGLEKYTRPAGVRLCWGRGGVVGGLPLMVGFGRALRAGAYTWVLSSEHYQPSTALACVATERVYIYQGQSSTGASRLSRGVLGLLELTCARWSRRRAQGVIAKTTAAADFARARGFKAVQVIPCGYDERRFYPPTPAERAQSRALWGLGPADYVLVYAGNLLPRRDVAAAIHALGLLKWQGVAACLLLAGQGPEEARLRALAEAEGVATETRFVGLLPWPQLRQLYWAGDLFIFPSRYEIFGLALLEAMACGLLPVSTPVGAAAEMITSGVDGWLVPVGQPAALAQVVADMRRDPAQRAQLAQAAQHRAHRASWASVAEMMLAHVRQQAKGGG